MKFGIGIPNCREGIFYPIPFAGTHEILKLTQLAERLGYDSVWGTDFICPVPAMSLPEPQTPNWYEPLISLAYLAGATQRIELGVGVVLLPYRDPVILAKQAVTLDQFSGGRLLFGWGLGHFRDEFVAIQTRNKRARRGEVLEENMEALHLLLNSDGKVSFKGKYFEFRDVELDPKPFQKPLPVYIAGHAPDTPARIARYAAGMSMVFSAVKGSIREMVDALVPYLEREGRDLSEIDRAFSTNLFLAQTREEAVKGAKESWLTKRRGARDPDAFIARLLVGTPEEVAEKIRNLEEQGVTHCVTTNFLVDTFDEALEQVQMFGEEVLPLYSSVSGKEQSYNT
ncbi:MAG: LLM class flavin-dependent oxidoreductase [Dehalococcoidia bacterium]